MDFTTKDGPVYDAGAEPASMSIVEKVPETGGELAEDTGPVMVPRSRVSEKPGGRLPVHFTAAVEFAATKVNRAPHVGPPPKVQDDEGLTTVKAVIA